MADSARGEDGADDCAEEDCSGSAEGREVSFRVEVKIRSLYSLQNEYPIRR